MVKLKEFLQRAKAFINENPQRKKLLLVVFILAIIPLTVIAALTVQDLRQRAGGTGIQIVDANGNFLSTTSNTQIYLRINLPDNWVSLSMNKNKLINQAYAQTSQCSPPYQGFLGCFSSFNSPSGSVCTSSCTTDDGQTGEWCYTSTRVGNSCTNSNGQNGVCNEQGTCVASAVSTSTPTPAPVVQCNYDAKPDGCNDISKFCYIGTCLPCSSGFLNLDQTKGCEAFSTFSQPTTSPIPTTPPDTSTSPTPESDPQASPTPMPVTQVLTALRIENKDTDGSIGGSNPISVTSNFSGYISTPISWKLNDLMSGQNQGTRVVEVTLFSNTGSSIVLSTSVNLVKATTPTETSTQEYDYSTTLGLKVAFEKSSGLPVKYIFEDGKEVNFDMAEIAKLKEKAIATGELQIAAMILLDNRETDFKKYPPAQNYSIEHPRTTELPKDVLSEKELSDKGVNILDPGDQNILFIRRSAFEEGELLADFNNTGRRLTIILLNGSTLDPKYINDPKYASLVKELQSHYLSEHYFYTTSERRDYLIKNSDANVSLFRKAIDDLRKSNKPVDTRYEEDLWKYKKLLYKYKNLLTDEQIGQEPIDSHGIYIESKDHPVIALSIGGHTYNYITISIGAIGDDKRIARVQAEPSLSRSPPLIVQPRHTYPNPQDFRLNPYASPNDPKSYLYGSNHDPGFALVHEISHDELIQQAINRGDKPNHSEYDTDIRAMEKIRKAWNIWEKSGYTDNSGYPFVFRLPPEAGGGYILTGGVEMNKNNPIISPNPTTQQTANSNPFDLNHDGVVNCKDTKILISQYGQKGTDLSADLNKDGLVDGIDYNTLVRNYTPGDTTVCP